MTAPKHIRIFISSPGDVIQERKVALEVIDNLLYDPIFREKIVFNIIAWDKAGSGTPMLATMIPQAAINAGMPKPSECDIVVVIFWSRMGTPLTEQYKKENGDLYLSGTEWEFYDALNNAKNYGKPELVVYRRTEKIMLNPDDHDFDDKVRQYSRVKDFFAKFRDPVSGAILQGYNQFEKPEDFRREFSTHLRVLVKKILDKSEARETDQTGNVKQIDVWSVSPFPGLEAFSERHEPIFFGRGRETDSLVDKVANNRLVAVVGASGSGKSSLVRAGLIPRLKTNAISSEITASKDWYYVYFTPNESPFISLAEALIKTLPALKTDPIEFPYKVVKLANTLRDRSQNFATLIENSLADSKDWAEIMLIVDQFEELFTLTIEEERTKFAELLTIESNKIRVILTLRSDFYHRAVENKSLADALRDGSFPLALPDQFALLEMITQPAKRAALELDKGLAQRIVHDTGNEPGALALMAYALDELYHLSKNKKLDFETYNRLEGVQGAIGKRAQSVFEQLDERSQASFSRVFRELVEVDEKGIATRQRVSASKFLSDKNASKFIKAFVSARLLVASRNTLNNLATVEVAHEALLRSWPLLSEWIEETQDDLRLLRQVKNVAKEWNEAGRPEAFLWRHERLKPVYQMKDRLGVTFDDIIEEFLIPEAERLLIDFKKLAESSLRVRLYRQMNIVDRLSKIGIPALGVMIKARPYATGSSLDGLDKAIRNLLDNFPDDKEALEALLDTISKNLNQWEVLWKLISLDIQKELKEILLSRISLNDPQIHTIIKIIGDLKLVEASNSIQKLVKIGYQEYSEISLSAFRTLVSISVVDAQDLALELLADDKIDAEFTQEIIKHLGQSGFNNAILKRLSIEVTANPRLLVKYINIATALKLKEAHSRVIRIYIETDNQEVRSVARNTMSKEIVKAYAEDILTQVSIEYQKKLIYLIIEFELESFKVPQSVLSNILVTDDVEYDNVVKKLFNMINPSYNLAPFFKAKKGSGDEKLEALQELFIEDMQGFEILLSSESLNVVSKEKLFEFYRSIAKSQERDVKRNFIQIIGKNIKYGRLGAEALIEYIPIEEALLLLPIAHMVQQYISGDNVALRERSQKIIQNFPPLEVERILYKIIKQNKNADQLASVASSQFGNQVVDMLISALEDPMFRYTGYPNIIRSAIKILEGNSP
jgi:hypothetical protein